MVTVRDATDADRAVVRDLHVASIVSFGPDEYADDVVRAWAAADDRDPSGYPIGEPSVDFVVAETGGEVVGFGEVTRADPDDYDGRADGEIRAVYVHPDHARGGVGSALLADLERRATDRGFETVALTASLNAVSFYEHHGYAAVETVVHRFGGAVPGEAVVMRKSL